MEKVVKYKGKEYTIEIKWATENYFVRAIGVGGFIRIPSVCLNDIESIKPFIIECIEYKSDLVQIEKWDGNL